MRRIILYIAMSIDGYIAADGDNLDWLMAYNNDEALAEDYESFYEGIDLTVMGSGTYAFVVGAGVPNPYPDKETVVFTHKKHVPRENINFVQEDPITFMKKAKEKSGKDIWLVGGGKMNALFLQKGLIDEIQLTLVPITLGSGTKLFEGKGAMADFNLVNVQRYDNGMLATRYKKNNKS